jgi:hypothetical protein
MPGLWEEIKRLAGNDLITTLNQRNQISSQSCRIAGNIKDFLRLNL